MQLTTNTRAFIEAEQYSSFILLNLHDGLLPGSFYRNVSDFGNGTTLHIKTIGTVTLRKRLRILLSSTTRSKPVKFSSPLLNTRVMLGTSLMTFVKTVRTLIVCLPNALRNLPVLFRKFSRRTSSLLALRFMLPPTVPLILTALLIRLFLPERTTFLLSPS